MITLLFQSFIVLIYLSYQFFNKKKTKKEIFCCCLVIKLFYYSILITIQSPFIQLYI
jgi:hypothetical protein